MTHRNSSTFLLKKAPLSDQVRCRRIVAMLITLAVLSHIPEVHAHSSKAHSGKAQSLSSQQQICKTVMYAKTQESRLSE